MRGVRDEEKVMIPIFPRLHVNDTEKGGPRAPPRNKMALYEQLSVPSQRFNSKSASVLPLLHNHSGSLASPASSVFGGGRQSNMFMTFCDSSVAHLAPKPDSHASTVAKLSSLLDSCEASSGSIAHCQTSNVLAEYSLIQAPSLMQLNGSTPRMHGNAEDYTVPALAQTGLTPHSDHQHKENLERDPMFLIFSGRSRTSQEKIGITRSSDSKSRQCTRNLSLGNPEVSLGSREKNASSTPLSKDNKSEPSKQSHVPLGQELRSSSGDLSNTLDCSNAPRYKDFNTPQDGMSIRAEVMEESAKINASHQGSRLSSKPTRENEDRSPDGFDCGSKGHETSEYHVQAARVNGCDVSEPARDLTSTLDIVPDDVVGVMGEKQFWKARKAIVNQQRVFAVQVFELHRLIKVQRLLSRASHLLEDSLFFRKPSFAEVHAPTQSQCLLEAAAPSKSNLPRASWTSQDKDTNMTTKVPLPLANSDFSKELNRQQEQSPYAGNLVTAASNGKPGQWCFPPSGNQWLVPIMSPSEGLIYKPYSGPCPPSGGVLGPIYGGCGPLTPLGGDLSTAYGIPASHHLQGAGILPGTSPVGSNYFLPYGMPLMDPSISCSAAEQINPFGGSQLNLQGNRWLTGEVISGQPHQSSCNVSTQVSQVISCHGGKSQTLKESEHQGSTGSSPSERLRGTALPLFPMEPTTSDPKAQMESSDQQKKVIKVVPHNPRLATESAARIFQSIQEERKQLD